MLDWFYNFATPWAIASPAQIIKNKVLLRLCNLFFMAKCLILKAKKNTNPQNMNVVVSLTSYPKRKRQLYYCLRSLLNQSVRPYETILWLAYEQYPNGIQSVDKRIVELQQYGLRIEFCNDMRSYKKILPTLSLYKDKIIVTADDDTLYPESWLNKLIKTHEEYPDCVCCYRAHEMTFAHDDYGIKINKYGSWNSGSKDVKGPSLKLMPVGVGGVLYPLHYFDGVDTDYSTIHDLAPSSDDLWLKFVGLKKCIRAVKVLTNNVEWFFVLGSQDSALTNENVIHGNGNDLAVERLSEYFGINMEMIDNG